MTIGPSRKIAVQTMCDTHTSDIAASYNQCVALYKAGAKIIRLTVQGMAEASALATIKEMLRADGIDTPLVADIHFRSDVALECARIVEKVRINPGNFARDHDAARNQFSLLLDICKEKGTAIRIGVNHGSLGERITSLYGNTPKGMAMAAMEWLEMCIEKEFYNVTVSLKASNTIVMIEAYRALARMMDERGFSFPLHLGVTEAGNGDGGRLKSAVGISTLLHEGLGDTIRVSLTEDPAAEIPVAQMIADRFDPDCPAASSMVSYKIEGKIASAVYSPDVPRDKLLVDIGCDWGRALVEGEVDLVRIEGVPDSEYLSDELMQACRRRFYRPEYIACPGCGRTMYDLQETFEEVKRRTAHLSGICIAVMGCIVNGPGEMADADYGYIGEGRGLVSIYKKKRAVWRHVPQNEAIDKLLMLIEEDRLTSDGR